MKVANNRYLDPESDSYDIWDDGTRSILSWHQLELEHKEKFPLLPYWTAEVCRNDTRWYKHINYHSVAIELLLSGSVKYCVENKERILTPGSVYIVARGSNVKIVNAEGKVNRKLTLLITGSCLDSIAGSLGFDTDQMLKISSPESVEKIMREIASGIRCREPQEKLSLLAYQLLLMLSRDLERCPDSLRPAIEAIANNPQKNFSTAQLAKICKISISTLRRRFMEYSGMTPQHYIRKQRLSNGADMLRNSNMMIKEIALTLGFSSQLRFAVEFKKIYGVSPTQFRKKTLTRNGKSGS